MGCLRFNQYGWSEGTTKDTKGTKEEEEEILLIILPYEVKQNDFGN
jgi:hypothetical protein